MYINSEIVSFRKSILAFNYVKSYGLVTFSPWIYAAKCGPTVGGRISGGDLKSVFGSFPFNRTETKIKRIQKILGS